MNLPKMNVIQTTIPFKGESQTKLVLAKQNPALTGLGFGVVTGLAGLASEEFRIRKLDKNIAEKLPAKLKEIHTYCINRYMANKLTHVINVAFISGLAMTGITYLINQVVAEKK